MASSENHSGGGVQPTSTGPSETTPLLAASPRADNSTPADAAQRPSPAVQEEGEAGEGEDEGNEGETTTTRGRSGPFVRTFKAVWKRLAAVGLARYVAAALIIAFVIVAIFWYKMSSLNATSTLCLTPACIHAASGYLTNLAPDYKTLDPCTDFEQFVCSGWQNAHDMREDQGMTDALNLMGDQVSSTIRHVLEGGYPNKTSSKTAADSVDEANYVELQKAYTACMDVDAITERGIAPITNLIDELATKWDGKDYAAAIEYLQKAGASSYFALYVGDDDKDPETQAIAVYPSLSFGLPAKSYFADKKVVTQYEATVAKVLGAIKPKTAKIGSTADDTAALVALEAKLTAAAPEKEDLDDVTKTYNVMPVDDTAALLPQAGLKKVLKALAPANYKLNYTITAFPDVLANVSQIVSEAPAEVVHNFFYWRLVVAYSDTVLGPEIKPWTQFQNVLQGKDADAVPERWRTCVVHANGALGWILSRFFVEESFSAAAKDFGNQIISDIKTAYLARFKSLKWMDDETKKVAAEKVHNIDQKVGYPDASPNILDPAALKEYYALLNVTDSYFSNALAAAQFKQRRTWESLGKPTDMQKWEMTSATVNAYYNPPHNEIVFPAAIMQFPLFSVDLPSYVSYGAFGAVAGHELSHAFDNNGRHYDVHGRLNDWWTNATVEAFTEKAECIVEQFNNYTVQGKDGPIHIKGRQTLGENICRFRRYLGCFFSLEFPSLPKRELSLPGLGHFTHEQLFFVSFGNAWCSKFRPAMLTQRVNTDEHSPDPVRIKGTVANSRAFREAFNCPVKEPTCELW